MNEFIDWKIREETDFIEKKKNEVTIDFAVVRSGIREEAFQEVKREIERTKK